MLTSAFRPGRHQDHHSGGIVLQQWHLLHGPYVLRCRSQTVAALRRRRATSGSRRSLPLGFTRHWLGRF